MIAGDIAYCHGTENENYGSWMRGPGLGAAAIRYGVARYEGFFLGLLTALREKRFLWAASQIVEAEGYLFLSNIKSC